MSARRLLWTGPYSADLRGRAVERFGRESGRIWVVATAMGRDELIASLARRRSGPERPRVFTWDDLWAEIARRHKRPPGRISEAARRSALVASVGRAERSGRLGPLARVADLPGFRRGLAARFAAWTLAGRRGNDPPPGADEQTAAEWAIYRHYRATLNRARVEDAPGFAAWAAESLRADTFGPSPSFALIDPVAPSRAQLRLIEWATRVGGPVLVTLPTSGDLHGDDPAVSPLRSALGDAEYEEEDFGPARSTGLAGLEIALFDDESEEIEPGPVPGLTILGGPKGEGLGLLLAREVARRLEGGARPDDLLVLVRRWDDDATRAVEILRSWGISAVGGVGRPLAGEPAVSALLLAVEVVAGGWEVGPLIRLLRNGQVGLKGSRREALSEAASTLQSLRVFRGLTPILDRLDRATTDPARHGRARSLLGRIAPDLDALNDVVSWGESVDRLRRAAGTLGLDPVALESFWDALDDHAAFVDADRPVALADFARSLATLAAEVTVPPPSPPPGSVRFATVEEAEGVSARVVFLTNLAEGTFPGRDVVSADADEREGDFGEPLPFAREKLRFLGILGTAIDEVVLLVPTVDEGGNPLLAAGFVEDIRRRLGHPSEPGGLPRLDPVFRSHPELAHAPGDARVLAVARACLDRDPRALLKLARDPDHREALLGAAAGLRLTHERLRVRAFTEYDGLLRHPGLVEKLALAFGPEHPFSPSQLESFAVCPFQFYQRYVLKLAPVDHRPELRVDRASQGERFHVHLEEIHAAIFSEGTDDATDLLDRLDAHIRTRTVDEPDLDDPGPGDVADGLLAIEDEHVRRGLDRYRLQFGAYLSGDGATALPRHFELSFGPPPAEGTDRAAPDHPPLEIGEADGLVRLSGKVDRVDLIDGPDGPGFRVIDYKTGKAPSGAEVIKHLRAVQLPLYALAVERYLFGDAPGGARDFGYWTLGDGGFKRIKVEPWPDLRDRVVDEVTRLARMLRHGEFRVDPQKSQCQRSCDYQYVCRIGQVRDVEKV